MHAQRGGMDLAVAQLLFGGKRQPGEIIERANILGVCPDRFELLAVERRMLIGIRQLLAELLLLQCSELLERHRLDSLVVIAPIGHAVLLLWCSSAERIIATMRSRFWISVW